MRPRPGTTGMTRRTRQRRRSPQLPRSPERRSGKLVTAQDVRDAAERLRGVAVRTPLRYVEPLDAYLKLENLQPIGAFKIRGAYNAISRLPRRTARGGHHLLERESWPGGRVRGSAAGHSGGRRHARNGAG